jgi:peptidoglycan biosynthesis protein MviN/MurJ (putative lipid II flippase)
MPVVPRMPVVRAAARICVTVVAFIVLYAVLPVPGTSGIVALLELLAGLIAVCVVLALQIRAIVQDEHPGLRAAQALVTATAVLLAAFAFTYLSVSKAEPASFSEPLDRIGAMYFTVTVLGTVGFGDIAARSDGARLLVTGQILVDLVLLVGIGRALVFAARIGISRRDQPPPS